METPSDTEQLNVLVVAPPPANVQAQAQDDAMCDESANKAPLELSDDAAESASANTPIALAPRGFGELSLVDGGGLTTAALGHVGDNYLASGLVPHAESVVGAVSTSLFPDLSKLEPEVLQWMDQCRVANGGIAASEDDVLYYFDTKYPELLEPVTSVRTFTWLHGFLSGVCAPDEPPRFSNEVKAVALHTLAASPEATTALVVELGLKSTTTLQYWKLEQVKLTNQAAATDAILTRSHSAVKKRTTFMNEKELVEWLLSHKHTPITNQDIVAHLQAQYPSFVDGRSSASVSVWVARFLKRHLPSESTNMKTGLSDHEDLGSASDAKDDMVADCTYNGEGVVAADEGNHPRKRRAKRKSPNGYVLHSNEFKLNALKMLDEGKTISEVAEELGIKCPNTLVYWNSIRDKLAVADKKRFRLAGGGRRSTCTFEDELMNWVSERHQKGHGTDVKAVLDYLQEVHPSFTEGKKEPTLRKWILRFFKRFKQSSVCTGAEDDLDKADGILV